MLSGASFQRNYYFFSGFAGGIAGIYLEQKRRRGELMLYTFPRAIESVYHVLLDRKIIHRKSLPAGVDIACCMGAFAVLMAG